MRGIGNGQVGTEILSVNAGRRDGAGVCVTVIQNLERIQCEFGVRLVEDQLLRHGRGREIDAAAALDSVDDDRSGVRDRLVGGVSHRRDRVEVDRLVDLAKVDRGGRGQVVGAAGVGNLPLIRRAGTTA